MRKFMFFVLVLTFSVSLHATGAQDSELSVVVLPNTESFTLTASTNQTEYLISVNLPGTYKAFKTASYPVLYLLDPDLTFAIVAGMAQLMAPDELPALIVVGVGYADANQRGPDYDTADDKFLDFLSEELVPYIDSHYRTNPDDRAILGFSLGGKFVLYTLWSQPGLFNRYVSISPAVPTEFENALAGTDDAFRSSLKEHPARLFISSGSREFNSVGDRLREQQYEGLELTTLLVANGTHRATLYNSLPPSIIAIYCGANENPIDCGARVRKGES